MIRTSRIITSFMSGKLLCLTACLAIAGALMLPGTSFGAWVTDSFYPNVTCNPDRPDPLDCVHAVAVQPSDGSVIVGGYISSPGSWLARFTSAGSADSTFNNNVNNLDLDDTVDKIVIQPDNKIIIGGHFTTPRRGIARLNTNGTLDTNFNPQLDNCDTSQLHELAVTALALQTDGNLLVGGTFKNVGGGACPVVATPYITTGLRPFFVRLMTAGTGTGAVDTAFTPNVSSTVHSIIALDTGAFASNKKILAAGNYYKMHCTYCGIATQPTTTLHIYNPGTPDQVNVPACTENNEDGLTYVDYGQCMSSGSDLVSYVALLNMSNGSRDAGFDSQRIVGEDLVYEIARQSDGKVLVAGNVVEPTSGQPYLQRMNSDGSIDGAYNPNANGPVRALAVQSGDNLITGGTFTVMGGASRNYIAQLTPAGGLDATFNPSADGPVYAMASSPLGLVIGGGFSSVGGVGRKYVARLYNDGKTTTTTTISAPLASYGTGTVTVTVTGSSGTPTSGTVTLVASGPTTTWTKSLSGSNIALFPVPTVIAGDHALSATYGGTSTYAASSATGVLTVTKAILTVTANSVSRPYLSSNPTFTASYSGFVNNETVSVLTGAPLLTTAATSTSPMGTYTINAANGSLTAANYSFGFVNGLLTVIPAATTTSVVSSTPTSTYGNPVTFTATVTGAGATGTVTFQDGGTPLGTGTLSSGTALYSTDLLSAGTHTITAVYGGDATFGESTSTSITLTVNKLATTTNISSNINPSAYNGPVTFTATVAGAGATGTVTFMDGAATLGTGSLSGGSPNTATYTTSALSVSGSPHSITAIYGGGANFATSSGAITQTITQATLTPVISSSGSPSDYGIPVTFTATLTGATGTVTFKDGAAVLGTATLTNSIATYTTSTLSVSGNTHLITADYGGDVNFAASTSVAIAQNIRQAVSTTSLTSNPNQSVYGSPVTFTATVTSGATGTVTFIDGVATLGTGALSGGSPNTATYTTSALGVAGNPHSIKAVYSGDANYGGSTSPATNQMVDKALPIITVVSSSPTSTYGNPVTFTANVGDLSATGTVTFRDGAATLGTETLSGGSASFTTTSAFAGGPHSITAAYSGDGNFLTSTSGILTQTVNKASTTTSVTSSLPTSIYGNQVTFTATVTGAGATGTVTFMDGVTSFGTGTLSNGTATYHTSALDAGGRSITAVYNGDGNFATSTSGAITQTVNKASTTTGISSNSNPSTYGGPVTFTATVNGAGATGTVTFMDGVATLGTGTLSGGSPNTANYTTSALDVAGSPRTIKAVYGGDPNHTGSNSSPVIQTTSKAGTITSVTSDFQTAALNTPVTFTATVNGAGASGTVQFYDNGNLLDTKTLSSGLAVSTSSTLVLGNHQITAIFSGDSNFNGSTAAPATLVVVPHTSSTTISSVQNPSDFGTLATFNSWVTGDSGVATGTVTFKDGGTTLGTITLSNGFAQYNTSTLGGGAHSITATYNGDANYGTSTSSPLSQTVSKANQTITFGALAAKTFGNADFAPGATASSNLPVAYISSNTSVAMVAGSNIHIVGAGNATITASQAGDNNYNAATSDQLLIVNKANQEITFGALAAKTFGNADFAPGATANSGLPVTYVSSNTSVATISGNNIHIVGAGNATITASQIGSGNYNAAADVSQTLTVNKANQTITFGALSPKVSGDLDFSPGASASSHRPVRYDSLNPEVATIEGSNVHIVGPGATTITASEDGDSNCNPAPPVQQPLTVVWADGKFNHTSGAVSAADALESLRIAVGIDPPDLAHGDVAPLVNGQRHPDGKIDLADVVAILRKAAGLSSWQ